VARIEWVETRLRNWARWRISRDGGVLGHATAQLGDAANGGRSGYVTSPVPIFEAEAAEMDEGVQGLRPLGLRDTVVEVYVMPGGMADHAHELCCSEATIYARLVKAHEQLAAWLLERQARRKAERDRVEALQPGSSTR